MPQLPAVENNLRALSGLLQDEELWGLPSDHCTVISNPTVAEEMIRPVKTAAAAAEDTLIVYFAGHGLLGMNGSDLFLTTPTADLDRIYNAVAYEHLRNELRSSRARNRIVILDCCYSGRALGGAMGPTEDNELIANMASVSGTYVMAAANLIAHAFGEYSEFSGELIRLINEGIPDLPEYLTVDNIFLNAQAALRDKNEPIPQKRESDLTRELYIVRNKWRGPAEMPDLPPVGTLFERRRALHDAGVHRPLQAGICGTASRGAESIVVSGGYKDDRDYGEVIIYTGHGGRDANTGRQVQDQTPYDSGNAALIKSVLTGLPVRVIRGSGGDPAYSPEAGYSYDGLYTVTDYWTTKGVDGFLVLQFRLERSTNTLGSGLNAMSWTKVARGLYADVRLADKLKRLYDYSCQVCDVALEAPGGLRFASAVHIKDLGIPHEGPDSLNNMLCLCSNHRDLFRYGAIVINDAMEVVNQVDGEPLGTLTIRHEIDRTYLRYHRERHSIYSPETGPPTRQEESRDRKSPPQA